MFTVWARPAVHAFLPSISFNPRDTRKAGAAVTVPSCVRGRERRQREEIGVPGRLCRSPAVRPRACSCTSNDRHLQGSPSADAGRPQTCTTGTLITVSEIHHGKHRFSYAMEPRVYNTGNVNIIVVTKPTTLQDAIAMSRIRVATAEASLLPIYWSISHSVHIFRGKIKTVIFYT